LLTPYLLHVVRQLESELGTNRTYIVIDDKVKGIIDQYNDTY